MGLPASIVSALLGHVRLRPVWPRQRPHRDISDHLAFIVVIPNILPRLFRDNAADFRFQFDSAPRARLLSTGSQMKRGHGLQARLFYGSRSAS
jgi:hypothetical protein